MSLFKPENMTIAEIIEKLQEAVDLGDSPHRGPFGTFIRKEYLVEAIEALKAHPDAQPNEPLTLEELRRMGGKPVWCEELQCWGIVKYETVGAWKNKPFLAGVWQNPDFETAVSFEYDIKSRGLTLYRRPPKGG